jgi:SAM-dependent methyltransferase
MAETPEEGRLLALFADMVRDHGGGAVADVGCGPGRTTAELRRLGVDAFGIDLSPGMIEVARRDYPGARFEVGSMTDLALVDASVTGLVAWYSLIHIPDEEIGSVLAGFHRVLRPGGPLLIGFHVGDGSRLKTEGYGGHPMKVYVHRRQHGQMITWLTEAGFAVETHRTLTSAESKLGGVILARRQATHPVRLLLQRLPGDGGRFAAGQQPAADRGHGGHADQNEQEVDRRYAAERGRRGGLRPGHSGKGGGRGAQHGPEEADHPGCRADDSAADPAACPRRSERPQVACCLAADKTDGHHEDAERQHDAEGRGLVADLAQPELAGLGLDGGIR